MLAGGRSRRFTGDKASAVLGGRTLLEIALSTLDAIAAETAVAARRDSAAGRLAARLGSDVLEDSPSHPAGPLAGAAAGLAWARRRGFDWLATLPCDVPLVTPAVFERLLAEAAGAGGAYAASADGSHALISMWRVDKAEGLRRRLEAGEHPAVREALAQAGARAVMFADTGLFRNINTRAELAAVEEVFACSAVRPAAAPR